MNKELIFLREPNLLFGYGQKSEDPKDGLTLFGPYETFPLHTIQVGVIGTEEGVALYKSFVERIRRPVLSPDERKRPSFPGFDAVYGITWPIQPAYQHILNRDEIDRLLGVSNLHERTWRIVNLYLNPIIRVSQEEDIRLDLWFIVAPKEIWRRCRPRSESSDSTMPSLDKIRAFRDGQAILFSDMQAEYEDYSRMLETASDFHDQLKARLLQENLTIPIQVVLEPTLRFRDKYRGFEYEDKMKAHLAWTQSATAYYKLGKLPWKLADIRKGVCYVGLVFKKYERGIKGEKGYACSAAQMFLDSGDGTIFRGNIGPWKSQDREEYHLDEKAAKELLSIALKSYYERNSSYPQEVFLHGRAGFRNREWEGFNQAIAETKADTKLVGVVIKGSAKIKLFRDIEEEACRYGNLRGLALVLSPNEGFLWTRGFVPKLSTSTSLEVSNPLRIRVDKGEANLRQVLEDILCLTKLNYNACIYGDGLPVTLRFANLIGSVLTAVDQIGSRVLPFKYYI